MAIPQVVNTLDANKFFGNTASKVEEKKSTLDMAAFLRLLTTQLANQNPLEPMKDTDFYAQLAQLGTVQGIDELKASAQVTQANALIGKEVTAVRSGTSDITSDDAMVSGIVKGMAKRDGKQYLLVEENGSIAEVTMENIRSVKEPGVSDRINDLVGLANSAGLIGKTLNAPHPTLKDSEGKFEMLTGAVKRVSFEKGQVLLTVTDRLGKDVKVNLKSVESFD